MLSLIQGFNERGSLYRETFSQYGPFFSEFFWVVDRVLGVPINHDGIRCVVLVLWVGSSVATGALAYRLAQSVWVALLVQAVSFHMLRVLVGEPGHPISLAVALLAAIAFVGSSFRESLKSRAQALLIGAFLGLLTMTKINLGLFAVAAIGTSWVYCLPSDPLTRVLRWSAAFTFGAMGVLLVEASIWSPERRFVFVGLFLCSLAAVLVSAPRGELEWPVLRRFGTWALGTFCLTVVLSIFGVLLTGTRWPDLMQGMIVRPLAMGEVFSGMPDMNSNAATIALFSFLGASGWQLSRAAPFLFRRAIDLALRLLFIGVITAWLSGQVALWTGLVFVWIAVLPPLSERAETERDLAVFGRLSLALLAVGQFLGIYPVSGAQAGIPSFFVSLCLIPVLRGLIANLAMREPSGFRYVLKLALTLVVAAAPGLVLAKVWQEDVRLHAYLYRVWAPLNLPGAQLLRPDPANAALYRCLAENLRHSRPSFVTLPGLNSLYGWAERPTPTGFNIGGNFAFLSHAEQQQVVEVARHCKPVALLLNEDLMFFWSRGRFQPSGPLVDFAKTECRSAGSVRGYQFMSLKSEPLPTLTYCARLNAATPDEPRRITITLPRRLGNVASASIRDIEGPKSPRKLLPLEGPQALSSDSGEAENDWEFAFPVPESALAVDSLDRFIVQLWSKAGEWVADVPFVRLPDDATTGNY